MRRVISLLLVFVIFVPFVFTGCALEVEKTPRIKLESEGDSLYMEFHGRVSQRVFYVMTPDDDGIEVDYTPSYDRRLEKINATYLDSGNYYFVVLQTYDSEMEKVYVYEVTVDDSLNGKIKCVNEDDYFADYSNDELISTLINDYDFDYDRITLQLFECDVDLEEKLNEFEESGKFDSWEYEQYLTDLPSYDELGNSNIVAYVLDDVHDSEDKVTNSQYYLILNELQERGYISELRASHNKVAFIDEKGHYCIESLVRIK